MTDGYFLPCISRGMVCFICLRLLEQGYDRLGGTSAFCTPSNILCWPNKDVFTKLDEQLSNGEQVLLPGSQGYKNRVNMKNPRVTSHPALIVLVLTNDDIRKCLAFAAKYNMPIAIKATGHDFEVHL